MFNGESDGVLETQTAPHDDSLTATDTPTAAEASATTAEPETELERLRRELGAAHDEVASFRTKYLRAEADMQNYRKMVDRQRAEAERAFRRNVMGRFLPVIDNLDRALAQIDKGAAVEALTEGVNLTRKGMLDVLAGQGVTPIEAIGAKFDPHFHEAIGQAPAGAGSPGEIVAETERGYTLDGFVLRPSRVIVVGDR